MGKKYDVVLAVIIAILYETITPTGCIRRTSDSITEDYDEIDRKDPPLFINNTRTKLVVASGKTALWNAEWKTWKIVRFPGFENETYIF